MRKLGLGRVQLRGMIGGGGLWSNIDVSSSEHPDNSSSSYSTNHLVTWRVGLSIKHREESHTELTIVKPSSVHQSQAGLAIRIGQMERRCRIAYPST